MLSNVKTAAFQAHTQWSEEKPTRLLLVRHGETDWNVRRVIQGWTGTRLNALGLKQAQVVARRVASMDLAVDIVLSSDILRARQTAQALAKALGKRVRLRADLRERCFGDWEGQSVDQVLSRFKLGPKTRKDPFLAFDPQGGESMTVFAGRMQGFLDALLKEHAGKTVVAVTHGGPVRVAACLATGIPPKVYYRLGRPGNVSLTLLAHQGGVWWLELYNDMAHLETKPRRGRQGGLHQAQEARL